MTAYRNILVAVDLTDDSQLLCDRAFQLVGNESQATVRLLHITEFVYQMNTSYDPLFYPSFEELAISEEELLNIAQKKMDELTRTLSIPARVKLETEILTGIPKTEVIHQAAVQQADLIICGSHGKNGFQLLLGSTANAILHHASCDVLAIRTKKDK